MKFTLQEISTVIEEELRGHSYVGEKYWAKRICDKLQASKEKSCEHGKSFDGFCAVCDEQENPYDYRKVEKNP